MVNPLMKYGYGPSAIAPQYTWIVNLRDSEEQLIARCEQTTRQAIRKYKKNFNWIVVEATNCDEDLETYIRLHEETYTRTGATKAILDIEYQRNIFESLIPEKKCRVFFLKELGGAYPYLRNGKKKGLNDFKKCFGCTLHPIFRGEYVKL